MQAVRINGALPRPIGAPVDWKEAHGHCGALFVRADRDESTGLMFMRSAWQAEGAEIGWLLGGANVHLGISAPQHPVVNMRVGDVPEFEPNYTVRPVHDVMGAPAVRVDLFMKREGDFPRSCFATASLPEGGSMGASVAVAIDQCEQLAREQGWL